MDNKKRQLVYSILEFLNDCRQDNTVKEEDAESLEVATQCLGEIFDVDLTNPDHQREFSIKPTKLSNIFDVFIRTQQKRKAEAAATTTSKKELTEEDIKQAEDLKNKGNTAVSQKDFKAAIDFYTQAIKINPENAVYYSNRAAAYSQDNRHDMAVTDAQTALKINPQFARAYSRLGHAYFHLSKYTDAIVAFEKGLELDPSNKVMQQSLETSKQKAGERGTAESSNAGASARSAGTSAGGMPDLSSILGGAGGAGGMPDLSSILSNPTMMNMASQMMQNPEMMRMAQQFMGGANGGQMPDVNELANNPQLRNMMNQFMGSNNNNSNNSNDNPPPGTS
ncbi:hypothetical protein BDF22DRAFT_700042 [Syncephalis plumigaleata]|nr:hypothetical protein BDF22DRAFT_700042 [Syncephalis plumigaleata]